MSARVHRLSTFFRRVSVDRLLVIILIVAVVVLGWNGHSTSKSYSKFTNCTVDYFVKDRTASNATTKASRELVRANNEAFKTIPIFFGQLLAAQVKPPKEDPKKQRADLIKSANDIKDTFDKSSEKYDKYRLAIKNNPRPPDPTKFCKEK